MLTKRQVLSMIGSNALKSMFLHFWDKSPRTMNESMKRAVINLTGQSCSTGTANALLNFIDA